MLSLIFRNSPTTTGGLVSTMARGACSQPTMCSWTSERELETECVNSVVSRSSRLISITNKLNLNRCVLRSFRLD